MELAHDECCLENAKLERKGPVLFGETSSYPTPQIKVTTMRRHTSHSLAAAGCLLAALSLVQTAQAGDCWLDIYDKTELQGAHARIEGPVDLPSLAKLNNENWGGRIESLEVGPKAKVLAFRQENFKENSAGAAYHGDALKAWGEKPESYSDQEISFGPGKKEHHLGESNFHRAINSLVVKCLP